MNGPAGRVIVVAGASSAAGRAVAAALGSSGATVVVVGSSRARLADVTADSRYECDLADPVAVDDLARHVLEEHGRVDGLIHLVGGWRGGQSDDDFTWLERRILTTLRNTTRSFRDALSASDAGRLAIVSSTGVDRPTWSNANYAALKGAAETWIGAIASGWRKAGTAAAVTFVVTSLGEGGTPVELLAERCAELWNAASVDLNGARIEL